MEAIRQKKLRDMQKKAAFETQEKQVNSRAILSKVFKGRAWEVFKTAYAQFPAEMPEIERQLIDLKLEGRINEMDGEQLYALLRQIGMPVRMDTTIRVISHGKAESLAEKFKKSTK